MHIPFANEASQDTAGPKITDEGHATIDNHLDGHISQSLPVYSETSASLLNGVGSVQQRSVSDGSQGLKTDGADQVTGPHTNSEGPVHVHSSSVTNSNQGIKTDGEDHVAGLSTNSEGPDHVSSSSVNNGNQGLKTEVRWLVCILLVRALIMYVLVLSMIVIRI